MSRKLEQLAARRSRLVDTIAVQRDDLGKAFIPLHTPLAWADKSLHMLGYITKHRVLLSGAVAGTAAVALAMRPKRWLLMLESGWMVWRMLRAARRRLGEPESSS